MKVWKRNAVVLTVVLFVSVALYLSWSYNREEGVDPLDAYVQAEDNGIGATVDPVVGEDPLKDLNISVGGEEDAAVESSAQPGDQSVSEGGNDYFSEARLTRKRARDGALEILNQVADRKESDQKVRDKAADEIKNLAKETMSEARIEGLVKAKGFADCVAYISEDGVNIVVASPDGGLAATDVARITDIVIGETKVTAADIHITEAKV